MDDYTVLNPGTGGDSMDETGVTYPSPPTTRKRPRVVITGEGIDEIVPVKNTPPLSGDYGLVVRAVPTSSGFAQFQEISLVPASTETTVNSWTTPGGQTFQLTGFIASGDLYGKWLLYVNSTVRFVLRTSAQNLNTVLNLNQISVPVTAGQTVELKVIHELTGQQGNFQATLLGHLI